MPRQARIDAPEVLHPIICRGIERQPIFEDDGGRINFIERLGDILLETETPCYAWALIPNHFHILVRTGGAPPIGSLWRRYAIPPPRQWSEDIDSNLRDIPSEVLLSGLVKSSKCPIVM
jgi:hypothetical protein